MLLCLHDHADVLCVVDIPWTNLRLLSASTPWILSFSPRIIRFPVRCPCASSATFGPLTLFGELQFEGYWRTRSFCLSRDKTFGFPCAESELMKALSSTKGENNFVASIVLGHSCKLPGNCIQDKKKKDCGCRWNLGLHLCLVFLWSRAAHLLPFFLFFMDPWCDFPSFMFFNSMGYSSL